MRTFARVRERVRAQQLELVARRTADVEAAAKAVALAEEKKGAALRLAEDCDAKVKEAEAARASAQANVKRAAVEQAALEEAERSALLVLRQAQKVRDCDRKQIY